MKILFLDESGDHSLSKIDPAYPLFVLGGVIMDEQYASSHLTHALDALKFRHFGSRDVVLHTADMIRNRNGFEALQRPAFREAFLTDINRLMSELDFQVAACAVHKEHHLSRYGLAAVDPYLLSLDVVVEMFHRYLKRCDAAGLIIAEARDATLDRQLELAWLNLKIAGTRRVKAHELQSRIKSLNLRSKSENIGGLQMADLVVSPIGRHVLGKAPKPDWEIVRAKLLRDRRGEYAGAGLLVLPE